MISFNYKALRNRAMVCLPLLPRPSLHFAYPYLFTLLLFAVLWTAYQATRGSGEGTTFALLPYGRWGQHPSHEKKLQHWGNIEVYVPEDVKVVGLVFYGRREFVKVLDCYLKVGLFA